MLALPGGLSAQSHEHASHGPTRDARLELVLGGPHLVLYHRGYLALDDAQVAGLQRLRGDVCDAELVYVRELTSWRDRMAEVLDDSPLPAADAPDSTRLRDAMTTMAAAESRWLSALMQARRDALALLSESQRMQASELRDHWLREATVMIEEATRPGQRGHPGMQLPIRVPGMVVATTTLLPHCEALHGSAMHISIPPPR